MDFPLTVDEITPEWLTQVLRESGAIREAQVESIESEVLSGGAAGEVQRLNLAFDQSEENAPSSIVAKLAHADPEKRKAIDDLGLYESEVNFFNYFGQNTGIRVPRTFFNNYDSEFGDTLILLEDLGHLRMVEHGSDCSFEDADVALRTVAGMHAKWWNDDRLFGLDWLVDYSDSDFSNLVAETYSPHIDSLIEVAGEYLPSGVESIVRDLAPVFADVMASTGVHPVTLNHGDYKPANLFFDDSSPGEKSIVAFDWQVVQRGRPASDVAQFLITSFDNDNRRRIESKLIENYYDSLTGNGVTGYSKSELEFDIRIALLSRIPFRVMGLMFTSEKLLSTPAGTRSFASICDRLQVLVDWNCDEVIPK